MMKGKQESVPKMNKNEKMQVEVSQILAENRGLIYYIIRPIVKEESLIEDCFSVVSEIIIAKYDKYYDERKGNLTAWLTKVVRNGALNFIKARKYQMLAGEKEFSEAFEKHTDKVGDAYEPENFLLQKEMLQELHTSLEHLSDSEKKLILRKFYYMQPMSQIAAEMGMSVRAAEGKLYRIKKKLRADIERQRRGGADNVAKEKS